jgi:endonuclease/exonuclease/phosphatase family metal-dependent hydrolase
VLSRFPVDEVRLFDLSVNGREPRSALDVDLRTPAGALRVVTTHLGLTHWERRLQVDKLLVALGATRQPRGSLLVLLGDFNEWLPVNGSTLRIDQALGATERARTFPAWRPLLPLDRVWVQPADALQEVRAIATGLTLRASDHLPICARVLWPLDG